MKLFTLFTISCLFIQISLAQTNNYSITCPENTFLGVYSCTDIDNLPQPVNTIEEAMAPPYNIQIEGDLPENVRAISEDDGVIFFCESDPRMVKREIIIFIDNSPFDGYSPEIGRCSFTIETIPDLSPPEFNPPPDIEIACGTNANPDITGAVTFVEENCWNPSVSDWVRAYFSDTETVDGETTIINRTWEVVDGCGNATEKQQIITINCEPTNDYTITCPKNTFLGAFSCVDIDNVPQQVNTIEEAMAPPYNIQIEGDIPPTLRVLTVDDDVIFFCKDDPRLVKRELIFYIDNFNEPWYGVDTVALCSFTIETIPDLTPIDFVAPPDEQIGCDDFPPTEVTFTGDDCFAFDQEQAFFSDEIRVEGDNTFIIRTWRTTDACGNFSEPQEQIFTFNCERPDIDLMVICPDDTFLGAISCLNVEDVPEPPNQIEEAMAAPYNIQIEGEISSDIRVTSNDNAIIFYCESDSRSVNRNLIIYTDINFNFAYDIGEEIGGCSYTIETIPDLTPLELTIPPDIEIACEVEPTLENTGYADYYENECPFRTPTDRTFYSDEIIVEGDITTILRSWSAFDPCGNVSEVQIQTITINCDSTGKSAPEIGTFNCGN